jgi:hypothetical protein
MLGSDAAEFFENDEDMMTFATNHDIMAAHAPILERQGKYGDSIRRHLKDDPTNLSEALDVAFRHISELPEHVDLFDTITDCFLWPFLSFGCRTWPESAEMPVGKIHTLLDAMSSQRLDRRKCNTVN